MRDEILLSRNYFDKVVDKIINETLNNKDCSGIVKLAMSMSMLELANDMEEELFGTEEDD